MSHSAMTSMTQNKLDTVWTFRLPNLANSILRNDGEIGGMEGIEGMGGMERIEGMRGIGGMKFDFFYTAGTKHR